MEEVRSNSGQSLGIAALITGIITFILAVIPCVGMVAIVPGIIAIILASVGLSQASHNDSPKGVLLAGLIIGIIAVLISISQIFVANKIIDKAHNEKKWPTDIQAIIDDVRSNIKRDLEDANVNIKIQSNGDTIEINAGAKTKKKNQEKELEDLESGNKVKNDSTKVKKIK